MYKQFRVAASILNALHLAMHRPATGYHHVKPTGQRCDDGIDGETEAQRGEVTCLQGVLLDKNTSPVFIPCGAAATSSGKTAPPKKTGWVRGKGVARTKGCDSEQRLNHSL